MLIMTDEQIKQDVKDLQKKIDKIKKQVHKGELEKFLYYPSIAGMFEGYLIAKLGHDFKIAEY